MIDYSEDWLICIVHKAAGSVSLQACFYALPSMLFTLGLLVMDDYAPEIRQESDFMDWGESTIWSALTSALMLIIGFRTKQAYHRFWEGSGLLHQMRGEWFETVSLCVSFSIKARTKGKKDAEVMYFRHVLVRLMSLAHGTALEEVSGDQFELPTIDPHGLDKATLRHLKECSTKYNFNKVETMMHLIQTLITDALDDKVIDVPAPILSRAYQTLSRGFVNLLNAKKITDTKFPFPYVCDCFLEQNCCRAREPIWHR